MHTEISIWNHDMHCNNSNIALDGNRDMQGGLNQAQKLGWNGCIIIMRYTNELRENIHPAVHGLIIEQIAGLVILFG